MLYRKHSIKQVYFQTDDCVKMIKLEKDHFMAQIVASKNCEAIYLMCLSFNFKLSLSPTCLRSCRTWGSEQKRVSNTWPITHFLYYSMNTKFSCCSSGGDDDARQAVRQSERQGTNQELLLQGRKQSWKSFYLSNTQCLSHFLSPPVEGNWEGLDVGNCSEKW